MYRTIKLLGEAGAIDRLELGDGRAGYEESVEHHEHLVDVEVGQVIESYYAELEALKAQLPARWDMILLITGRNILSKNHMRLACRVTFLIG